MLCRDTPVSPICPKAFLAATSKAPYVAGQMYVLAPPDTLASFQSSHALTPCLRSTVTYGVAFATQASAISCPAGVTVSMSDAAHDPGFSLVGPAVRLMSTLMGQ